MPIEAIENIPAPGESQQPIQEPQALPAPLDTNVDGDELDHANMEAENQPHVPQPTAEDMEVEAGDRESTRPPSSSRPTSRPTTPVMRGRSTTVVVDEGNGGTTRAFPADHNEHRRNPEPRLTPSMELLQRGLPPRQDHSSCRRWTSRRLSPARTEQRDGPTNGWERRESPPRPKRRSTSRTQRRATAIGTGACASPRPRHPLVRSPSTRGARAKELQSLLATPLPGPRAWPG